MCVWGEETGFGLRFELEDRLLFSPCDVFSSKQQLINSLLRISPSPAQLVAEAAVRRRELFRMHIHFSKSSSISPYLLRWRLSETAAVEYDGSHKFSFLRAPIRPL
jgi:hypothetical protein